MRTAAPWIVWSFALLAASAQACGSDEDDAPLFPETNPCADAQKRICERACQCGGGVGCPMRDEGTNASTFDSFELCQEFLVQGLCDNPDSGIDFPRCQIDVEIVDECTPDSTGIVSFERPRSCYQPPPPVDAGTD